MPTARPTSLIVTFYGAYGRRLGGWIAVSHLVTAMADIGLDDASVRAAISRLKRRDWLQTDRRDGLVGYALSPVANAALAQGDARIYGPQPAAALADGWLLATFSVPERERHKRHLLRSRLSWLGFGTVGPGVWLAPYRVLPAAANGLRELGLADYVELFHADHAGFGDVGELVARAWDLAALRTGYADFLDEQGSVLELGGAAVKGRAKFAGYLRALDRWRRLPYLDPGLPAELLPQGWEGHAAAGLFARIRATLEEPAYEHLLAVIRG